MIRTSLIAGLCALILSGIPLRCSTAFAQSGPTFIEPDAAGTSTTSVPAIPPPLLFEPPAAGAEELPVAPPGLIAPQPDANLDSVEIDLRPGSVGKIIEEVIDSTIQYKWINEIADDNALIWREHRNDFEILPRDSDGLGLTTLNFGSSLQADVNEQTGVWLVPRFAWTFVSGPNTPDVASQLYDLRLEGNFAHEFNDVWDVHLQLAPTFATDWDNKSDDAVRIIGGGLVAAHLTEQITAIAGAMYLDRPDLPVLPIGGFRWRPQPAFEVDAVFPSPRLAVRYSTTEKQQHWLYLAGQLGGGSWAIDHTSGLNDTLSYRDLRCVIGLETRKIDGSRDVFEAGYVFDRQLDFARFPGDQQLGATAVIRWGSTY